MKHDDMIAVIVADKNGEELERRCYLTVERVEWGNSYPSGMFDFSRYEYRVKKKIGYINIYGEGRVGGFYGSKEEATTNQVWDDRVACIKVEYYIGQHDE